MPSSDCFGGIERAHGIHAHDNDIRAWRGGDVSIAARSEEPGYGCRHLLLCAQSLLLFQTQAVCHT